MFKSITIAGLFIAAASPVLASDTQAYQQGVTQFAYEKNVDNFCPAGLQPIRYNGVVCCGQPNATGYGDAPVVRRRSTYVAKSPSYAPDAIPMGKSPDSMDGT